MAYYPTGQDTAPPVTESPAVQKTDQASKPGKALGLGSYVFLGLLIGAAWLAGR